MKSWEFIKKEKKLILLSIAIVIFGVSLIYFIAPKFFPKVTVEIPEGEEETEKPQIESFSPEFTLGDINGEEVNLEDYKGKATLLTFWTTWHPVAVEQLPILDSYYQKIKNDDQLALLTINNAEEQKTVSNFINRAELSLPVLLDCDGKVGELYKITAIPLHIFINKQGKIKEIYIGSLSQEEISEKLNLLR